jgi:hypothetical protein
MDFLMSVNDNRSDPMQSLTRCPYRLARGAVRMIDGRHDPDRSLLINY